MHPIIMLLAQVLSILQIGLIIWFVLSLLISFNILNRHQTLVWRLEETLTRLYEPMIQPLRRIIPSFNGIDLAPMALLLILQLVENLLYYYAM